MFQIKNLSKEYRSKSGIKTKALDNINLKLPNNGLIALVGKSGSGKSTFLNVLGGLDKADNGEILLNGKNILEFKDKTLNSYRNTYLGFVFQDYHLISNLNVKENLEVALELQKQKNNKGQVEEILNKVGLNGYEKRKVNELSGGQMQRVAIARALIKQPQIILADEPTGNLDSQTSKEIFKLLKDISKEKLIILVTHDYETAEKYADSFLEISDGKIIKNTIDCVENVEENSKLKKGRLTFFKSIKYAIVNLRRKKIRLIITTLIMTVALFAFAFLLMLTNFNINKIHTETMLNNESTNLKIKKPNKENELIFDYFNEKEFTEISELINEELNYYPNIISDNNYTKLEIGSKLCASDDKKEEIQEKGNKAYYGIKADSLRIDEKTEKELNKLNIIGKIPSKANEVLISQILADRLIALGVETMVDVTIDNVTSRELGSVFFDSYEDIINHNKNICIGGYNCSAYIKITGIIKDESLKKYDPLKEILNNDMINNPTELYNDFIGNNYSKLNMLTVNEDFTETMIINENNELDFHYYPPVYIIDGDRIHYYNGTSYLTNEINIYNGKKSEKINALDDNQIVLSKKSIIELFPDYNKELNKYNSDLATNYQKKLKEYNNKIEEQEKKLLEDPDYINEEIESPKVIDYEREEKNFFNKFIKEYNIIGKTISLEITDLNDQSDTRIETIENLKIIGIYYMEDNENEMGNTIYVSKNLISKYMRSNFEITEVTFNESDKSDLIKLFEEFDNKNKDYMLFTDYSEVMDSLSSVVKNVEEIAKYVGLGTLIFTIILFMNFIINSINTRKKDVGILRAIGASSLDIYKMFYLETTLVAAFSLTISTILSIIGTNVANKLISENIFIDVVPIEYNFSIIIYTIIFIFIFVSLVSLIGFLKISKTKPIKLIYDK